MEVNVYQSGIYSINIDYKEEWGKKVGEGGGLKLQKGGEGNSSGIVDIKEAIDNIDKESAKVLKDNSLIQLYLSVSVVLKDGSPKKDGDMPAGSKVGEFNYEKINEILNSIDYKKIGYEGKPIDELSSQEAAELVGEDGFFGIKKTSERVAGFVISGAGDDLEKLKAGRRGVIEGFKEAERIWGGELPEIAYKTQERTLKLIDERIAELGGSILDSEA